MLVGPSGSGKTTAMRLINRMIPITGGDILLGGRSVLEREPRQLRREIGYVIQQIGLFPHQTVGENIATVPRLLGWPKERIAARVHELLELIDLDPLEMAARYPSQLSGGQRQRVGVARALAADPPLMLMDEPFGAIDPINRTRLQDEFLRLQEKVKKTVVFVTHDIDEAIKMGDRIAILREGGVLAQYDTPARDPHPPRRRLRRAVRRRRSRTQALGADHGSAELKLVEPNGLRPTSTPDGASRVRSETSVRDALSLMLSAGGEPLTVVDEDGRVDGLLTLERGRAAAVRRGRRAVCACHGDRACRAVRARPAIHARGAGRPGGAGCACRDGRARRAAGGRELMRWLRSPSRAR